MDLEIFYVCLYDYECVVISIKMDDFVNIDRFEDASVSKAKLDQAGQRSGSMNTEDQHSFMKR